MIQLFTHYVPGRSIVLATLEALVLLMAAYVGISLDLAGSGAAIPGVAGAIPSQAFVFALGMMIVMSSMGLYQPDLWSNTRSIKARLIIAFLLGFAITGLVSYLMPSLHPWPVALGATILLVASGWKRPRPRCFSQVDQSGRIQVARAGAGNRLPGDEACRACAAQPESSSDRLYLAPTLQTLHSPGASPAHGRREFRCCPSLKNTRSINSWSLSGTGGLAGFRCSSCWSAK